MNSSLDASVNESTSDNLQKYFRGVSSISEINDKDENN